MPEIIENYDYFTNGKSEANFEEWQSKYSLQKKIGEGSYANVRVAIHKDLNEKVAIKIYDKKGL
jgi:serine/threonine protein kinase